MKVAEIPLSVELLDGGGATAEDAVVTIEPKSIVVSGTEEALVPLKKIVLGQINLAEVVSIRTYTFSIPLTGEISNESGITEAVVTVEVKGLPSKVSEVNNIELINVPPGYRATAVQVCAVWVRGPEEALSRISEHQIVSWPTLKTPAYLSASSECPSSCIWTAERAPALWAPIIPFPFRSQDDFQAGIQEVTMTQTAQVKALIGRDLVEVAVQRRSACSHNCSECSGCELTITNSELTIAAEDRLGCRPGDLVLVESASRDILGAAVVVYLVPFMMLFAGYFVGRLLAPGEGYSVLISCAFFLIGLFPARVLDRAVRKHNGVSFRIIEILKPCSDI